MVFQFSSLNFFFFLLVFFLTSFSQGKVDFEAKKILEFFQKSIKIFWVLVLRQKLFFFFQLGFFKNFAQEMGGGQKLKKKV